MFSVVGSQKIIEITPQVEISINRQKKELRDKRIQSIAILALGSLFLAATVATFFCALVGLVPQLVWIIIIPVMGYLSAFLLKRGGMKEVYFRGEQSKFLKSLEMQYTLPIAKEIRSKGSSEKLSGILDSIDRASPFTSKDKSAVNLVRIFIPIWKELVLKENVSLLKKTLSYIEIKNRYHFYRNILGRNDSTIAMYALDLIQKKYLTPIEDKVIKQLRSGSFNCSVERDGTLRNLKEWSGTVKVCRLAIITFLPSIYQTKYERNIEARSKQLWNLYLKKTRSSHKKGAQREAGFSSSGASSDSRATGGGKKADLLAPIYKSLLLLAKEVGIECVALTNVKEAKDLYHKIQRHVHSDKLTVVKLELMGLSRKRCEEIARIANGLNDQLESRLKSR